MAAYYIKDKVAIVTGGASGIGLSCVKELLRNGLQAVTIADINIKKGEDAIKEIENEFGPGKALFIKTDVTKADEFEDIFKTSLETWKGIDIVINNAGIMNDCQWEFEIAVNCSAVVRGSLLAMQYMGKENGGNGGLLINIGSILGLHLLAGAPVHVATKHFVIGLTRSLGTPYHYKRSGVRVLTLCPGITETPHLSEASQNALITLSRDIGDLLAQELRELPSQSSDFVAQGLIIVIAKGNNGSVWVIEENKGLYEVVRTFKPT